VTLARIRAYSTVIAIVVWTLWVADMSVAGAVDRFGKIKGTDFLQFYVGGSFAREGRLEAFYDADALHQRAVALVPASRDTIYLPVQSPQTALVFAPLATLGYVPAVAIWFAVIFAVYAWCCHLLWQRSVNLHAHRGAVIAAAAAFPGLYSTILNGQSSIAALAAVTAALLSLERGRRVAAGLALGCLAFKPHWCVAAVLVVAVAGEWRVAAAAIASASAQIAAAVAIGGAAAMTGYAKVMLSVQRLGDLLEPRPGDSLRAFFKVFVPWPAAALLVYAAVSVVVIVVAARTWRSAAAFEIRAAALIIAIVLISPHAFGYDLILLAPVFFFIANWLAGRLREAQPGEPEPDGDRALAVALCALFFAPILTAVPAPIRLQFSVTAMVIVLARASRVRPTETHGIIDGDVQCA
jgi:alpha-1,2-mannosyltransferase